MDIPQDVVIHLGIGGWVQLNDTPLLMPCIFQFTVLGLTRSSRDHYMPVFLTCNPSWCLEAGHSLYPYITLMLPLVKVDFLSDFSYHLILLKTRVPDNLPPRFPPGRSCLATPRVPRPCHFFVAPSYQIKFSRTRSKSTSPNLRCRTTSEVGIFFSKFSKFLG